MGADERLEGAVEVFGEGGGKARVGVGGGEFDPHIRLNTLGPRVVAHLGARNQDLSHTIRNGKFDVAGHGCYPFSVHGVRATFDLENDASNIKSLALVRHHVRINVDDTVEQGKFQAKLLRQGLGRSHVL